MDKVDNDYIIRLSPEAFDALYWAILTGEPLTDYPREEISDAIIKADGSHHCVDDGYPVQIGGEA